jgi:hypothetical protein
MGPLWGVVVAPNDDTIYGQFRLDLSKGPTGSHHPGHDRQLFDPHAREGRPYVAGRRGWMVNPSFPSTLTAPVFPPSKSPEARRWPVANS